MPTEAGRLVPPLPQDRLISFAKALLSHLGVQANFSGPDTRHELPYGSEYVKTVWRDGSLVVELVRVVYENPENSHDGGAASHYRAMIGPLPGGLVLKLEGYPASDDLERFSLEGERIDPGLLRTILKMAARDT